MNCAEKSQHFNRWKHSPVTVNHPCVFMKVGTIFQIILAIFTHAHSVGLGGSSWVKRIVSLATTTPNLNLNYCSWDTRLETHDIYIYTFIHIFLTKYQNKSKWEHICTLSLMCILHRGRIFVSMEKVHIFTLESTLRLEHAVVQTAYPRKHREYRSGRGLACTLSCVNLIVKPMLVGWERW